MSKKTYILHGNVPIFQNALVEYTIKANTLSDAIEEVRKNPHNFVPYNDDYTKDRIDQAIDDCDMFDIDGDDIRYYDTKFAFKLVAKGVDDVVHFSSTVDHFVSANSGKDGLGSEEFILEQIMKTPVGEVIKEFECAYLIYKEEIDDRTDCVSVVGKSLDDERLHLESIQKAHKTN